MPSKMESEINPVLKVLVDAAGEVGKAHGLKIGIVLDGRDARIIVDRKGEPRGDLCLGAALEVCAAARVAYERAAAIATASEMVLTIRTVKLVAGVADPALEAKETPAQ